MYNSKTYIIQENIIFLDIKPLFIKAPSYEPWYKNRNNRSDFTSKETVPLWFLQLLFGRDFIATVKDKYISHSSEAIKATRDRVAVFI